jgi:hypothetical protein
VSGAAIVTFALLVTTAVHGLQVRDPAQSSPHSRVVLSSNPDQIWNRTYSCLLVRHDESGNEYGLDTLDPLLWPATRYLLTGDSYRRAVACLDEFLRSHAERLIRDPLRHAILQHAFWAVFDWLAAGQDLPHQRGKLETRLAEGIRRLALTPEQIEALPDNYGAAAAAGLFAAAYDPDKPQQPFLPPDLFRSDGPWVCLTRYSAEPTAIVHFTGRSRFLVFLRLPGGRNATRAYIEKLRSSSQPPLVGNGSMPLLNLALPQFPVGTAVALVRQMIVIDNTGMPVPTGLTESVQFRVYHAVTPGTQYMNYINGPSSHDQDFSEFRMSRGQLFANHAGGLVAVGVSEREFATFMTHGMDPFESTKFREPESVILESCRACHSDSGIHSVQSRTQWLKQRADISEQGSGDPIAWESGVTIARKERQADFKRLRTLWQRTER